MTHWKLFVGPLALIMDVVIMCLIGQVLYNEHHYLLLVWMLIHIASLVLMARLIINSTLDFTRLHKFQLSLSAPNTETEGDSNHLPINEQYLDYQLKHFHLWN